MYITFKPQAGIAVFVMVAMIYSGVTVASRIAGMVLVPAGEFIMGTDKVDTEGKAQEFGARKPWYADEHPQHKVFLDGFYMDTYEVSNEQYRRFVKQTNYWVPATWELNGYLLTRDVLDIANLEVLRRLAVEKFRLDMDVSALDKKQLLDAMESRQAEFDNLPVTGVTWRNATDYCQWAGKRLPTEAEWEKAARGPHGLEYPWGNDWDTSKLNAGDDRDWEHNVAPVTEYEAGKSPYGVYQMAGNVTEWVANSYQPYPGSTYKSDAFLATNKVVRGGGWGGVGHYAIHHLYRAAYRFYVPENSMFNDLGFRCARDAK